VPEPPRVSQISPTDAAWLAGIIDGEGCFTIIRRATGVIGISLQISNTCEIMLHKVQRLLGGHITNIPQQPRETRSAWQWRISAKKDLRRICLTILPYLVSKRPQAIVALTFCDTIGQPGVATSKENRRTREKLATLLKQMHRDSAIAAPEWCRPMSQSYNTDATQCRCDDS